MSDKLLENFAIRLKELRENRNLSQEQLAYKSHIDRTHIGRIERLERNPSLLILGKIAKGLEIKLSELVDVDY